MHSSEADFEALRNALRKAIEESPAVSYTSKYRIASDAFEILRQQIHKTGDDGLAAA